MKKFLVFFTVISLQLGAQKFADKKYYLIDSLVLSDLIKDDKEVLESALKCYHAAKNDTSKMNCLIDLTENCSNEIVWPKYNLIVLSMAKQGIKRNDLKPGELAAYKAGLAGAYNNMGYLYTIVGNYKLGEDYCLQALQLLEEAGAKKQASVVLSSLGVMCQNRGELKKAIDYLEKAMKIQKELGYTNGYGTSLNNMALCYQQKGDFVMAEKMFQESLKIVEAEGNKQNAAQVMSNIAYVNQHLGNVPLSLVYNFKSLKIREELKDKHGWAQSLNNIAGIYVSQNENSKAIEFYNKCFKLATEINDNQMIAKVFMNLGSIHEDHDPDKALEYFEKGLKILTEVGDTHGIAQCFDQIGYIDFKKKKYTEALEFYQKALKISIDADDVKMEASVLNSLARLYNVQKKFGPAKEYAQKSLDIGQKIGLPVQISEASYNLCVAEKELGNWKDAYKHLQLHYTMRDSTNNQTNRKASIKSQFQYEYNRKVTGDSIRNLEKDKLKDALLTASESKLKQEKTQRYALYGGLALLVVFGGFMYNRFQITNKQKKIIEDQKALVDEKQKEVLDSITYAKRLQEAILPPLKLFSEKFQDSFVLYKPKAIVAGDFYWMEIVDQQNEKRTEDERILIAAADCTGHGVPGAMVSVVCSNALNRTVKEFGITEPGKILDKVRELVIETFEKSGSDVKDGMDISLCSIQQLKGQEGAIIKWAGANNSLWIISEKPLDELYKAKRTENTKMTFSLFEIACNKQAIGKVDDPLPFTTHSIQLNKGDSIYLFTDGFSDQFGGPKGKKFKNKQFQQKLMESFDTQGTGSSLAKQGHDIDLKFELWKGGLEQIDDVCVIGIRI